MFKRLRCSEHSLTRFTLAQCILQAIEQLQAELQKLRSETSPMVVARGKLAEYAQDQDKLQHVIESLQVISHTHTPQGHDC